MQPRFGRKLQSTSYYSENDGTSVLLSILFSFAYKVSIEARDE